MDNQHNDQEYTPPAPEDTSFLGEVWAFLGERKLYWLTPIIVVLLLLGGLFVFAGGAGALSPFLYMM